MDKFNYCLQCILLFIHVHAIGQSEVSHKYGKIKIAELTPLYCPIDSNAAAYYIFDEGSSYMLTGGASWRMAYHRHYRIHLLDRSARQFGTINIPLYTEGPKAKEDLIDLRASTYNVSKSKITETKFDKKYIQINKTSDLWSEVNFSMADVRPGSIIEIEYTIHSDFWNSVPDWEFQHDIPALESEYTTAIPEDIRFKAHIYGDLKIAQGHFSRQESFDAMNTFISQYYATDIPSFPRMPYIHNRKDHISRAEFELISTENDNGKKDYSHTWTDISKELLADENFGKQLNNNTFLLEVAHKINSENTLIPDKIKAAYDFIHLHMKWNGEYGVYPSVDIQKSYDARIGNVADINLLLIKLLRALEIPATPVLLSTVLHGKLLPDYAALSKVNEVIVAIPQDEKLVLLDASDPFASFDLIPPKCFNGPGLMLHDQGGTWININPSKMGQVHVDYILQLNADHIWEGTYAEKDIHYSAYKVRDQIIDSTHENDFIENIHDLYPDIRVSQVEITGLNESEKELTIKSNIKSRMGSIYSKDSIEIIPIQMERMLTNPFIPATRSVPVEYDYPSMINASVELMIPPGYQVDHMPRSVVYQNASKTLKYTYLIQSNGDLSLITKSLLIINQSVFSPEEYPDLKAFFELVVKKQAESIVFKKQQ